MWKFLERINRKMRGPELADPALQLSLAVQSVDITPSTASGRITVTCDREEAPKWRRKYAATFNRGFRVEIELKSWICGRMDSAYLYQPNGKYISFEARAVADKIIDRDLYPVVQAITDEILAMDKAFMRNLPNSFTDESGDVWRRIA